uniref:Chromatin-remodeling ATPase INO80 n=1 Tax=Lates calcarifer TaxID=8187 RepID=A0A4W6ESW8_LATCA
LVGASASSGLAKPLYLQRLERSLRLDSFLRQTATIFNRDITRYRQRGVGWHSDLTINQKADKTSLYNFSKLKKNRKWLKSILLSDDTTDSDTDSDDSDFSLSREELHDMLRLHRYTRQHQSKFHSDRELHQYQYYSTGLLSNHDPFYEQQRHLLGPKKKKIKDEKKFKAKLKKVKKKKKRGEGEFLEEGRPYVTKIFAKFSHDAPLPMVKKKHLTIEQLNARRRKVWLTIAKKEIPKSFKQKTSAKNLVLTNAKKLAHQCMREVRRAAIQAQKNCKETLPRARRLTKEMMLYWKKYEKVEKEHRKRAEKEALEQRKLDEEMREAKRQQRKLNFLITQTELYAHFMSGKASMGGPGGDTAQEEILRKLEDTAAQRQIDIGGGVMVNMGQEDYDSDYYKSQALRNAKEAYQIHQERTRMFDEEAKDSRSASLHVAGGSSSGAGSGFGESYSLSNPSIHAGEDIPQPTIFNGKLKGYQLKGMNWLANLYEQGINGILADEMGLGKTVQSIALLAHLAERDNIWAQALKSSTSVRWKILLQFQCRNRLLLTGTPIQNTMAELWALLHFIMPTLFDSHEEFNEWFSKDIESHAENKSAIDENQLSRLHMILKPFMLRRIKKDVENELSDKIEILTYCQLTSRQRLLYQALRNKISIEDLLQSSMGTAQQSHSTTSSLMNLVMQFRKVCNHPDLFERQETRSPFHMSIKPYIMSKFLYRHGLIHAHNQAKNKLLQVLLSPFSPNHIQQSLFHRKGDDKGSCFSFLRFIDVSPAEMSNLMLQGTLVRWLALFLSLKSAYRLHYQPRDGEGDGGRLQPGIKCLSRKDLILWLNRPTAFPNMHTSPVLQVRTMQSEILPTSTLRPCQPTLPPKFLLAAMPRVTAVPMERYCDDRSAEYEWWVTRGGGGAIFKQCFLYGSPDLASEWRVRANAFHPRCPGGVMALYPRHGWSFIQIPDKESLITESGKLHTLDILLSRLKAQGHRVLIYSQMTRMIDLLEVHTHTHTHTHTLTHIKREKH